MIGKACWENVADREGNAGERETDDEKEHLSSLSLQKILFSLYTLTFHFLKFCNASAEGQREQLCANPAVRFDMQRQSWGTAISVFPHITSPPPSPLAPHQHLILLARPPASEVMCYAAPH